MEHLCKKCGRKKRLYAIESNLAFIEKNIEPAKVTIKESQILKKKEPVKIAVKDPILKKTEPIGVIKVIKEEPKKATLPQKINLDISDMKSDRQHYPQSDRLGAILARVEENVEIDHKIFFTVGISNNRSFYVNEAGDQFTFRYSGMYRLVFRGLINGVGKLKFKRTPGFNRRQEQFAEFDYGKSTDEVSTMLPFNLGDRLEILFNKASDLGIIILQAGSQLEIYRVDDI